MSSNEMFYKNLLHPAAFRKAGIQPVHSGRDIE